ncbi:MAG: ShlB/FhaC/HecB family hemolysin secretion/activation protein [Alphaproteobacteria bacterium]|nr:ShlB/FhaC/HecB family hemolysin secretion/activation protein [Alphaproteobacteria bacterium]MCB9985931.1 ShlB/FhaC/HecB family hemolysin secretion/activation protein [Micavibrio sp.]
MLSKLIFLPVKSRPILTASLSIFGFLLAGTAMAQTVPGTADVSRVQGHIEQTLPRGKAEAPLKVEGSAPFTAPDGAEKMLFTLQSVEIEGQTVYPQAKLEKLYASKVGTQISLADVYALAAQLTAQYRNDGYILTQVVVPPQTIAGGVIKLRVVEGSIDQIRIEGNNSSVTNDVIGLYAAELKSKKALNNKELEHALLLINDLPGVTARGVLSPSRSVVGASDLTIVVERNPFDAQIGVDNYGSRFLGRWEVTGGVAANSLLGLNELLSLNMAYAPSGQGLEPELTYGEVLAQFPIGRYGTKLAMKLGITQTEPGASLDEFDVKGHARYAGLSVDQPFIRTRDFNLSASLGFDVRETRTKSNIEATREDDLSVIRVGAHTDWVDTVLNAAVTNIDMEVSRGVSWFGASDKGDTNMSRPDGDPEFTKITASLTRLERVIDRIALQTSLSGQMSNGALLSAEEFGVGGTAFGRGFDPSELVGDDGFGGSVELQWNQPVPVTWVSDYTVYGFYDIGLVWNDDATTNDGRAESLASVGLGIRTTIMPGTDAGFMVAVPLTRDIQAENDNDVRPFLNISHRF